MNAVGRRGLNLTCTAEVIEGSIIFERAHQGHLTMKTAAMNKSEK